MDDLYVKKLLELERRTSTLERQEKAVGSTPAGAAVADFLSLPGLRGLWMGNQIKSSGDPDLIDISGRGNHLQATVTTGYFYQNWMRNGIAPIYLNSEGGTYYYSYTDIADSPFDISGGESYVWSTYQGLTFGFWIHTPSIGYFPGTTPVLLSKWNYATAQRSYQIQWEVGTPHRFCFLTSNDGSSAQIDGVRSTVAIAEDSWYFVVGRLDYHTSWDIFVNGTWTKTSTGHFNSLSAASYAASFLGSADVALGRAPSTAAGVRAHYWGLFISGMYIGDRVIERIYNRQRYLMRTDIWT